MNNNQIATNHSTVSYVSIKDLIYSVLKGTVILREVKMHHVKSIKQYMMDNFEKESVYFPSLVWHLNQDRFVEWPHGEISVIDGSHRMEACIQLHEMAQKETKSTEQKRAQKAQWFLRKFHSTHLPIQLYQGLTKEEQDQLYLDFNSKTK